MRLLIGTLLLCAGVVHAAPVDVTTLGVIPNDGNDDSSALTAALQNNQELFLPAGVYTFNSTVYIPSQRRIAGAGKDVTTIQLGADTVAFRIEGSNNVKVSGMTINRPFDNSVEEAIFVYSGALHVHLDNMRVTNQRSRAAAFVFNTTTNCAVTNSEFIDVQRRIVEDGSEQVYGSGITFNGCAGVHVENNTVTETRNLALTNSTKYNWYQAGAIQVSGCRQAVVRNNRITLTGNGIDVGGTLHAIVEYNQVDNCHETGIKLVNGSSNQIVRNNYVTRCGLVGIWMSPGSENLAIRDCIVEDNVLGQIGQGTGGNDYWDGWFNSTVPAGIHMDSASTTAQRSQNLTVRNNSFYDNASMQNAVIIRPGGTSAQNVTQTNNQVLAGALPSPGLPPSFPDQFELPALKPRVAAYVPGSLQNATVSPSDGIAKAFDQIATTRALFNDAGHSPTDRWRFDVDIQSELLVESLALYGEHTYRTDEASPGGVVDIAASNSPTGPFIRIGTRNFGADRATNPFTGGKGKRIHVTPTTARYLRISGGQWSNTFDNNVIISEVIVNPRIVLDNYSPIHNPGYPLPNSASVPQQSTWNVGGGFENDRVGLDLVDGKLITRLIPTKRMTFLLDMAPRLGTVADVDAFIFHRAAVGSESFLPKSGTIRASSTNDPANMDLVVATFDEPAAHTRVVVPVDPAAKGRYFQIELNTSQAGSSADDAHRIGEVDFFGRIVEDTITPVPTPTPTPSPTATPFPSPTGTPNIVDVTSCGAIPNDGLDDSAAFAQCLLTATTLNVPPGVYHFAQTVFIPSNRVIRGAGMEETSIVLLRDTGAFRIDNKHNVTISDLTIDRPFDNSLEEMVFAYNGSTYVTFERIRSLNNRSRAPALRFIGTANGTVRDCIVIDTQRQIFEDGNLYTYGSGITFEHSDQVLVECNRVIETRDLSIENSPLQGTNTYYQAGAIQTSSCTNVTIRGNYVYLSGNGIDAGGTFPALIENNWIDNIQATGIKLVNGSAHQIVRNNYLTRCGINAIWLSPGSTDLPTHNCLVENNTIAETGQGVGFAYWRGFMGNTAPAAIHLGEANSFAGRCYDNIIRNNITYDDPEMVDDVIVRPSDFAAINTTIEDNQLLTGEPPAPPANCSGQSTAGTELWRIE